MDFSQFMAAQAAPEPEAPAAPEPEAPAALPDWPIAVYRAVDVAIPGEPFVAYPLVPKRGGHAVTVRCAGPTAEAARAKAREWIAGEAAKVQRSKSRGKN